MALTDRVRYERLLTFWGRLVRTGPWMVLTGLAIWHLSILWSMFAAGSFGFFDVTLISDWFTNAIYHGRPFHVTATGSDHLAYNFTPSVLLFAPFFFMFESQFVLLVLGASAAHLAIGLVMSVFLDRTKGIVHPMGQASGAVLLAVFLSLNIYTKTVLISAHFEIFFAIPALIACRLLLMARPPRRWVVVTLLALAVGVRQDAGFYLSFLLLGLALVKRPLGRKLLLELLIMSLVCLLCTISIVKWIMPAIGYSGGLRFWTHYGTTPFEIVGALLDNPARLLADLRWSGLIPINRSFDYYHWLTPYGFFANLPGIPLYLTRVEDFGHRMLFLYNASLLLPGFYLGVALGWAAVIRGFCVIPGSPTVKRTLLLCASIVPLWSVMTVVKQHERIADPKPAVYKHVEGRALRDFDVAWEHVSRSCRNFTRVGADFRTIVFLPNNLQKELLDQSGKADVVIWRSVGTIGEVPVLPPDVAALRRAGFVPMDLVGPYRVFTRIPAGCRLVTGPPSRGTAPNQD